MASKKQTCICCKKEKLSTRDYYKNNSTLFREPRMVVCKDCIDVYYKELLNQYEGDTRAAFKHLCFNLCVFFDEDLYESCVAEFGEKFFGKYMMKVNCNKEYKDKTTLNNKLLDDNKVKNIQLKDGIISDELTFKWGEGYTAKEYARLEQLYKKYINNYPSEKLNQQDIIKDIAISQILKERAIQKNDVSTFNKLSDLLSKKMGDLDVLPSKSKIGDDENVTLGTLIEIIQKNDPIPEPDEEFLDVNKIEKHWGKYFREGWQNVWGLGTGDKNEV